MITRDRVYFSAGLLSLFSIGFTLADEPKGPAVNAGKCQSATGTFIRRDTADGPFINVENGSTLMTNSLLLGLPGAALTSLDGGVRVDFLSDFDRRSPYPVLETAVRLNPPGGIDIDLTLDRGRVDITNVKKTGTAAVQVRFRDERWYMELAEPGTRVAVLYFSRHARGSKFSAKGKTSEPVAAAVLLVIKGHIQLTTATHAYSLSAPPGPAIYEHDASGGSRPTLLRLKELPPWASPEADLSPEAKKLRDLVTQKVLPLRAQKPVGEVLDEMSAMQDPYAKRLALIGMGSTDDLPRLTAALANAKDFETWDFAISVLRHWLGRTPGQDKKLYKYLTESGKLKSAQAETVIQLLHGFDDVCLACPETYEVLIEDLKSETRAICYLAAWHLRRLVPAGQSIPFPLGKSKEEIEKIHAEWLKLIPPGKLPPKPNLQ